MSNILDIRRGGSFLERKSSSQRMRDRDTAGGRIKPHSTSVKKKKHSLLMGLHRVRLEE